MREVREVREVREEEEESKMIENTVEEEAEEKPKYAKTRKPEIVNKPKVQMAIRMYAAGRTKTAIAEELDMALSAVNVWFNTPAVMDEVNKIIEQEDKDFRDMMKKKGKTLYGKALNIMGNQLDSENEWIQQNAARDLLTRFQTDVTGAEANTVTVHVIGMPEIGESSGKDDA